MDTEKTFADAPIVKQDGHLYRDLTGVRFGKLVVLRRELRPDYPSDLRATANDGDRKRRRRLLKHWWYLRCDCGNECWSGVAQLRSGHKITCGCSRIKPLSPLATEVIRRFTDPDRPAGQSIAQLARTLDITKGVAVGILYRAGLVGKPKATLAFPPTGTCYWMFGDFGREGFHWCGEPCKPGSSYCTAHHKTVYEQPKPVKKPDAATALAA